MLEILNFVGVSGITETPHQQVFYAGFLSQWIDWFLASFVGKFILWVIAWFSALSLQQKIAWLFSWQKKLENYQLMKRARLTIEE